MASTATGTPAKSSCTFCNIVNKLEHTEILYEDEEVCVFRDIKPASRFHILTIPKRHIEDAKALTSADKDLVEKLLSVAKEMVSKNNLSEDQARFGYHWPPFRSVKHLHLHTIVPESDMGFIGRLIFMKDSYWFVSAREAEETPTHILTDCPCLMRSRNSILGKHFMCPEEIKFLEFNKILQFFEFAGLDEEL